MRLHEHEIQEGAKRQDSDGSPRPSLKEIDREQMIRIARGE